MKHLLESDLVELLVAKWSAQWFLQFRVTENFRCSSLVRCLHGFQRQVLNIEQNDNLQKW